MVTIFRTTDKCFFSKVARTVLPYFIDAGRGVRIVYAEPSAAQGQNCSCFSLPCRCHSLYLVHTSRTPSLRQADAAPVRGLAPAEHGSHGARPGQVEVETLRVGHRCVFVCLELREWALLQREQRCNGVGDVVFATQGSTRSSIRE